MDGFRDDGWTKIGNYTDPDVRLIWVLCPKHGLANYQTVEAATAAVRLHDFCENQVSLLSLMR